MLDPFAEAIFGLAAFSHAYCLLVLHRVIRAPAVFHMRGLPDEANSQAIQMLAGFWLISYLLSFIGSAWRAAYKEDIESMDDAERLQLFKRKRVQFAFATVLLSTFSWLVLLGITYGTGGFVWTRRWP
jgi:hypothetical protein